MDLGKVLIVDRLVSIHAPRMGGDAGAGITAIGKGVSIHAPRVGGDYDTPQQLIDFQGFQSTPPAWGATAHACCHGALHVFQSTPPRVGGDRYR